MNVTFNGGGTFIFPNAFADLPKTRRVWAKRGVCAYLYNVCVMVQNRDISKQEIQEMLVRRTWLFFSSSSSSSGAKALSKSSSDQYALVLTKLRIFQLDKKGLRKIVMMDAWLSIDIWCLAA